MAATVNHKQQSAHRSDLKIKQRRLDQNFPVDTVVVTDLIGLGWIIDFGWEQGQWCRWERSQNWPVDVFFDTYDWMRHVHISYS